MAKEFAENARKLREKMEREASKKSKKGQDIGGVSSESNYRKNYTSASAEHKSIRAQIAAIGGNKEASNALFDESENIIAQKYVDARILPVIDDLVYKHTDGSQKSLTAEELENSFKEMMSRMVEDGVMKQEEMDAYTKPKSRFLRSDGPSALQKDIKKIMLPGKDGKLETLDIQSFADKCWNIIRKICKSCGLTGLAAACGNRMSAANKEKINEIETRSTQMTEKIMGKAKNIGSKVGTEKVSDRLAKQTKIAMVKRARSSKSGISR